MIKILSTIASCVLAIGLVGCGGGSSTPTPTPTPSLPISPGSANVTIGGSQTFTSSTPGVTWSLTGPGTINQNGVYLAPSTFPGVGTDTATVTATGGGGIGTATVTVVFPNNNGDFQSGPIKLGTSGGNVQDISATKCCIGTLGSLLNRGGTFFILSNNHVLDRSSQGVAGEVINQPGPSECFGASSKAVATLTQGAPLKPTAGTDPNGCTGSTSPFCGKSPSNVDAAIAQISSTTAVDNVSGVPTGTILDLGTTAGATSIPDAPPSSNPFTGTVSAGLGVAKSGRTSGLTCSQVQSINGPIRVTYDASCDGPHAFDATFQNQIVVTGANFIQPGDSGSLLVTSNSAEALGLLYASGTSGAVANPIADVFAAFNNGTAPTIVGGPDHAVSCAPTATLNSAHTGLGSASTLTPQQRQAATSAMQRHMSALNGDPAIKSVAVGASFDNPGEGAVVIEVIGATKTLIPATFDGVRTRVIYAGGAPPAIAHAAIDSSTAVLRAHQDTYMSQRGIQGMGVGASDDNPAETAIVIYTITGVAHDPIPAVIDGVRTKIIDGTPFQAK